jgi:hypothetical protein
MPRRQSNEKFLSEEAVCKVATQPSFTDTIKTAIFKN